MGAYLSHPITEKHSTDESNESYTCGASSMQGWRMTQEDAHNCILNFDKNASLFTVFDGHGGAEVALYCAAELPRYLKIHEEYKKGNYEAALREAFIGFDGTLVEKTIIEELKKLIPDEKREGESGTEEDCDEENLDELHEESRMSISEVLEKYKDGKAVPILAKLKAGEASGSKPISPYLRGRSNGITDETAAGGASSVDGPSSSDGGSGNARRQLARDIEEDEAVSSSSASDKLKSDTSKADKQPSDVPDSSSSKLTPSQSAETPASSSTSAKEELPPPPTTTTTTTNTSSSASTIEPKSINGDAKTIEAVAASCKPSQENEISTNSSSKAENVSSSSSSSKVGGSTENGAVSSNSSTKSKIRSSSKVVRNMPMQNLNFDEDSSSDDEEDDSYNEEKSSSTDEGDDGEHAVADSDDDVEGEDDEEEEDDSEGDVDDEDMYPDDDDDDDSFLNNMIEGPGLSSGCTAVVALVVDRELFVANAGDSRCVVCRAGKALDMSIDHKPEDKEELDRIKNAGGKVTLDGRVNGGLNLSRAIGDHAYKMNKDLKPEEQMISALPDIKRITITPDDEFMVIACDGIWNYMTSEEVVEFVKKRLDEGQTKISSICEELFTNCLAPNTSGDGTGCDNMTAVIVTFKPSMHDNRTATIADGDSVTAAKKRCATSQVRDEAEAVTCAKRIKTDEATVATGAADTEMKSDEAVVS